MAMVQAGDDFLIGGEGGSNMCALSRVPAEELCTLLKTKRDLFSHCSYSATDICNHAPRLHVWVHV